MIFVADFYFIVADRTFSNMLPLPRANRGKPSTRRETVQAAVRGNQTAVVQQRARQQRRGRPQPTRRPTQRQRVSLPVPPPGPDIVDMPDMELGVDPAPTASAASNVNSTAVQPPVTSIASGGQVIGESCARPSITPFSMFAVHNSGSISTNPSPCSQHSVGIGAPVQTVTNNSTCMSTAPNIAQSPTPVLPTNIVTSIHDSVGLHVPLTLKEKIWNQEYINLALLLKGDSDLQDLCAATPLFLTAGGQLEARPKQSKDSLKSVEQWTDAFVIYSGIYLSNAAHSAKHLSLFKYIQTIRSAAKRHGGMGWKLYDEQFRMRMALVNAMSWAEINQELWLLYMFPGAQGQFYGGLRPHPSSQNLFTPTAPLV
jgi:hypothetical protein